MSKMNEIKENTQNIVIDDKEQERLDLLAHAKELGIKVHPATGIEKIRSKIAEFLEPVNTNNSDSDNKNNNELSHADSLTYAEYNDMDALTKIRTEFKEKIKALEKTELKNPTWEQAKELRNKIAILNQHIIWATKRFYEIKEQKKIQEKKGKINNKVLKQSFLVNLIKDGKSLTTIVTMPAGISKEEIESLITPEIEKECIKYRSDFSEYWVRWKNKYLTSK